MRRVLLARAQACRQFRWPSWTTQKKKKKLTKRYYVFDCLCSSAAGTKKENKDTRALKRAII
jgi:hypothetical protein